MGFKFQVVLSPWAQEVLYAHMLAQEHTSFKKFLVDTIVEAAESDRIVERAVEIAREMVGERAGK